MMRADAESAPETEIERFHLQVIMQIALISTGYHFTHKIHNV